MDRERNQCSAPGFRALAAFTATKSTREKDRTSSCNQLPTPGDLFRRQLLIVRHQIALQIGESFPISRSKIRYRYARADAYAGGEMLLAVNLAA
jgi:hypothetical protein